MNSYSHYSMDKYNHFEIEKKWQERWAADNIWAVENKKSKDNAYVLDMFPYPSGAGLHVGHPKGYTATDVYSRYLRMNGKNVLHPIGWDAFGLPTENYAIKAGIPPAKATKDNVETFTKQIQSLGLSYDWSRQINTSTPEYYKWTQWMFLFLYKHGLAYKKKAPVNWCESCQTVLAREQVIDGRCERCKNDVVQKELKQWFFKITEYADRLLEGLEDIDWPTPIKAMQKNWIGKSKGALLKFEIRNSKSEIEVYTTRPDTLFGATYMVLAPEHSLVKELKDQIKNWEEVSSYVTSAGKKSELERTQLQKEKSGVELKGVSAINPGNGKEIPVWIADYVMASYGTGAIMAVPAHDERDFEFAQKFGLPIHYVIAPVFGKPHKDAEYRKTVTAIVQRKNDNKILMLKWKKFDWIAPPIGGIEDGESIEKTAEREVLEETGYKAKVIRLLGGTAEAHFFADNKNKYRHRTDQAVLLELENEEQEEIAAEELEKHEPVWLSLKEALEKTTHDENKPALEMILKGNESFTGDGVVVNSGEFDGMDVEKAAEAITNKVGGEMTNQYKLRDWLISRQRYWGAPIPIVYCETCGEQPVPEDQLPVKLPEDVDFKPTGESPLAQSKEFNKNVTCPKCHKEAKREVDTMDTFVDSSWYFLRYCDPSNEKEFASKKALKAWMPVDSYVGGAEHAVLHLLYARFFYKALYDHKEVPHKGGGEPFTKLRNVGLVMADDGRKMSKSLGNVVNPNDVVKEYGADSVRLYEMFMGPFEDALPWQSRGIVGVRRFLDRVYNFYTQDSNEKNDGEKILHKTIKKVSEDIVSMKYNTAISQMMVCMNAWEKTGAQAEDKKTFLKILAPFAPHLTQELWEALGEQGYIDKQAWPSYNEKLIEEEKVTLAVQVNGKVRAEIEVSIDESEDKVIEQALAVEGVKKWVSEKEIVKKIYIPGRIVNFVVK